MSPRTFCCLAVVALLFLGCVRQNVDRHRQEIVYEDGKIKRYSYLDDLYGQAGKDREATQVFFDAIDIIKQTDPSTFPEVRDLPVPSYVLERRRRAKRYTGLIRNYSHYDISIPSDNSGATLVVPAHASMEYVVWTRTVDLTGFVDGMKIYHEKIIAEPRKFKYLGKFYDFVADIKAPPAAAPEPEKPAPKKPARKKKKGTA